MKIKNIQIRDYRNIHSEDISLYPCLNIFVGKNAQGKTNLVEAIVFLSLGRSFRTQDIAYLIKKDEMFSKIVALIETKEKEYRLEVVLNDNNKFFTVNRNSVKKLSDFIGICNVVLFQPEDVNFFSHSPNRRRKNLDFELGKFSKTYMQELSLFHDLLSQRNSYLKQSVIDDDYLNILTNKLIESSWPLFIKRRKLCELLEIKINKYYQVLTLKKDKIQLEYKTVIKEDLESLRVKMQDSLTKDKEYRITHVGIHRDDYIFKINGEPIGDVASQGQRRLIMLAFKLAMVDVIKDVTHEYPILCLDDLFSELDMDKRATVLELLPQDLQVFITTTDLGFVKTDKKMKVFKFESGSIIEEVV